MCDSDNCQSGSDNRQSGSDFPALSILGIGCVRYLNSRPLIHAYPGAVTFEHPSLLAPMLASGELDLALIPIFEIIRTPSYRVVDHVAIACRGAVYSVFLAYTGDLSAIRRIKADPASMTSVNLMQVLFREFHGISPELDDRAGLADQAGLADAPQGKLLIGNQAIEFRKLHGNSFKYLDLGEEWLRCTSLPFVFAAWALRPGVAPQAAEELRRLKSESLASLEEIIAAEADPDFARDYLTEKIRFDLGEAEKEAIALFAKLLEKHALCKPAAGLRYV